MLVHVGPLDTRWARVVASAPGSVILGVDTRCMHVPGSAEQPAARAARPRSVGGASGMPAIVGHRYTPSSVNNCAQPSTSPIRSPSRIDRLGDGRYLVPIGLWGDLASVLAEHRADQLDPEPLTVFIEDFAERVIG